MVSKEYRSYLKSPEWKEIRLKVIAAHDGKCQKCKGNGNHVHHITYRNLFNEPLEDLMLLCEDCHQEMHKIIDNSYKRKDGKKRKSRKKSKKILLKNPTRKQAIEACIKFNPEYKSMGNKDKAKLEAESRKWAAAWGVLYAVK